MRRYSSLFLAIFMLLCTPVLHAQAEEATQQARSVLETSINKVLDIIKDPAYANTTTRPALRQRIEAEIRTVFDFDEFSSRTVGPNWRGFSPEQKTAFNTAFADLLLATYLDKINGYNGEKVAFTQVITSPAKDRVEVQTVIILQGGKNIPVAYRMLPKDGSWRVYDVLVEGLSLVKNYRSQFQDILSKGTAAELTQRVQERAKAVQEKTHAPR